MRQNRRPDELRPITIQRGYTGSAAGSVLIQAGRTTVLCTASVDLKLPEWMAKSTRGWVTAEYSMLPGSTAPRKAARSRDEDRWSDDGDSAFDWSEPAQVVDLEALGPRSIYIDCDVLEADGGTRTLSITGGFLALFDAVRSIQSLLPETGRPVLKSNVAAISVGIFNGETLLDLEYTEDSQAEVDLNVVMNGQGEYIEIQGTAEGKTFQRAQLDAQLALAEQGIRELTEIQRRAIGDAWEW